LTISAGGLVVLESNTGQQHGRGIAMSLKDLHIPSLTFFTEKAQKCQHTRDLTLNCTEYGTKVNLRAIKPQLNSPCDKWAYK